MNKDKKNTGVFYISILITVAISVWAICFSSNFQYVVDTTYVFLTHNMGWLYLISMTLFVVFAIYLAVSKWGKIKLGNENDVPEYSTLSWFAMLFTAGMGVGLVFWGVAEPLSHYIAPPAGIDAASAESANFALKSTFMHWGIHPWACYAVVGLALAYCQYKKKKPALISATLEPIIGNGKKSKGIKCIVDVLAAFATIAGVVTSLGLGVIQINEGLNYLFNIPNTLSVQILIIVLITIVFTWSAIRGIDKGIKMLSNINLWIAFFLVVFTIVIGPKLEIVNNLINSLGHYLGEFVQDSITVNVYSDNSWYENWRIFYWAWWIAWAPFVGVFIARISKGRTIREFIIGVIAVPSLCSFIWFSVFGTLGIHLAETEILSKNELLNIASNPETGLFVVFSKYPFGMILSGISIILLFIFFVTSADSGTFVLTMLTSKGTLNPNNKKKFLWGLIEGIMAIGLLIAGKLKPLQTISIVAALPFTIIMLLIIASIIKMLKESDKKEID